MEVSHLLPILVNLTLGKAPLVMTRQEFSWASQLDWI